MAEELFLKITCLEKTTQKCITFTVPIEKEVARIDKSEEIAKDISYILQFMLAQDLWPVHYQILLIICLKDFIELNVN